MPSYRTEHFGEIEYQDGDVLTFPFGLPGFGEETKFLSIQHPKTAPVVFLQSLARPELCFVTLPVQAIDANYRLQMSSDDLERLGFGEQPRIGEQVTALVMLCCHENGAATVNLLGPVVIRNDTRQALQAIRDDHEYSAWHSVEALCS